VLLLGPEKAREMQGEKAETQQILQDLGESQSKQISPPSHAML
jgi:hypothetical protein